MHKPDTCCKVGSYGHQVPMAIAGRRVDVDLCVADIVAALNAANLVTTASCCGHGQQAPTIILADGRRLTITSGHANTEESESDDTD